VLLARAKVNLWLQVVGRRADGFHLLDSLVAFTDLADEIEVAPGSGLTLEIAGPVAASLEGDPDNLVLKAAHLLAGRAGVAPRAAIRLTKRIPVAAGLGGGSADAAATLLALVELWRIAMPPEELFDLATTLGADVPMCLAGRPAVASGIGDRLAPAPALPACAILLVNPGVALPTPAVFSARQGNFSAARPTGGGWLDLDSLVEDLARRGNDLTEAAISLQPEIADVIDRLRRSDGVAHVAMSGSGATCFGLYGTIEEARHAASHLPASWWRHAGRLV
jgi:4-diphosphocytidyl-2-C-methyl-D-erythritol kinase